MRRSLDRVKFTRENKNETMIKIPFTNLILGRMPQPSQGKGLAIGINRGNYTMRDLSGFKLSFESLFSAYRLQSDVFSCIREWRENIGLAGYSLKHPTDETRPVAQSDADEIKSILSYWHSWRELKSRIVRDCGVTGNAFLEIVMSQGDKVLGFQPLDPRTISIISNNSGTILKYIQRIGSATVEFEPQEILHFRLDSDPNFELLGFSPMETIIWEARTDLSAMMANYYFFENDAQPAVQYILESGLSEEQVKAAQTMITEQFKGVKNRNKSGIMQGIKEIKTFNISQKDMEFLQGRRFTTEKICAAYGVPKFMLGYTDTVNNNNGTELKSKFYESTIQPLEEMVSEVINEFFKRIGLADRAKFVFNAQSFLEQRELEDRCMKRYQGGAMTLRQLKTTIGEKITPEDEKTPNIDAYILQSGASAVLLQDVGIDPMIQDGNAQLAQNLIDEIKTLNHDKKSA